MAQLARLSAKLEFQAGTSLAITKIIACNCNKPVYEENQEESNDQHGDDEKQPTEQYNANHSTIFIMRLRGLLVFS